MELKDKLNIEKITFETFKILNAQFPRKNFYIWFLNLCGCALRAQDSISLVLWPQCNVNIRGYSVSGNNP